MPDLGAFSGILRTLWAAFWFSFVALAFVLILRLHLVLNRALPLLDAVKGLLDELRERGREAGPD